MKPIFPALLISLALAAPCAAQPAAAPPRHNQASGAQAERPATWARPIDASRNLYQIAPGLYRSAQPEPSDVALLTRLGIRTIINLRANHQDQDTLDLPGVKLIHIPMDAWHIGDEQIISALRAIRQAQPGGPVLIHCQHGADRTGVVAAMYRIIEQGWTRKQALRELREGGYGFHPIWANIPRYIRHADIEKLRERLAAPAPAPEASGADPHTPHAP